MASSSTEGPYRLIPLEDCTLDTCDLATRGRINYLPNLAGNDLFIALFAIIFLAQIVLGLWKRTWGFTVGMCAGLILEVVGYAGRVKMHNNPFLKAPFIMYLVCLTLAPAFLSGAIYLCLSRIVVAYDERVSRLKPWQYTAVFMTFDLVSLILQAAGGAMAATGDDQQKVDKGKNIMVAGLAWQVVAMTIFAVICADYARRVGWKSTRSAQRFPELTSTGEFKAFLLSLCLATLTIYVRSVFRCAELADGFHSKLANDEISFMVLEGAMIAIAVISLTAFHPGVIFGEFWERCNFKFSSKDSDPEFVKLHNKSSMGRIDGFA